VANRWGELGFDRHRFIVDVVHVGETMLNQDDLSATVVAERDTVELKKYVADREARLSRTWHQIALPVLCARGRKEVVITIRCSLQPRAAFDRPAFRIAR
jgi:hypothetical protein